MFSMPNKTGSVPMRCLSSGLRFNFVYKANFHRLRPLSISDTTPCTALRWATVRHFFSRFKKFTRAATANYDRSCRVLALMLFMYTAKDDVTCCDEQARWN
jgi:hypothetical protein